MMGSLFNSFFGNQSGDQADSTPQGVEKIKNLSLGYGQNKVFSTNVYIEDKISIKDGSLQFENCDIIFGQYGYIQCESGNVKFQNCKISIDRTYANSQRLVELTKDSYCEIDNSKITIDKSYSPGIGVFQSRVTIRNSAFEGCFSDHPGAAIYSSDSNLEIKNSTFNKCKSNASGGAILFYADKESSTLVIIDCLFNDCFSYKNGGAISTGYNPKLFETTYSDIMIKQSSFDKCNATDFGGAINLNYDPTNATIHSVDNCLFNECTVGYKKGGGIFDNKDKVEVVNCCFNKCKPDNFRNNKGDGNLSKCIMGVLAVGATVLTGGVGGGLIGSVGAILTKVATAAGTTIAGAAGSVAAGATTAATAAGSTIAGAAGTAATTAGALGSTIAGSAGSAIKGAATVIGAVGQKTGVAAVGELIGTAGTTAANTASGLGAAASKTAVGKTIVGATSAIGETAASFATAASETAIGKTVIGTSSAAADKVAASAIGKAATTAAAKAGGVASAAMAAPGFASTVVGAGTIYSVATAFKGFSNMQEAERFIKEAEIAYEYTRRELYNAIDITINRLEHLNEYKVEVYATVIKESIDIMSKVTDITETKVDYLDSTKNLMHFYNEKELAETITTSLKAKDILGEIVNGSSLMKSSALSVLGIASQFGFASTGVAISSLNGAAAKNATLAFLGGGAKAVGGGGMAVGQTVLGGLTILPTAIILSHNYAKRSEKVLTEANKYFAEVMKEVENMNFAISVLKNGIDVRIDELYFTLNKLVANYERNLLDKIRAVYYNNKDTNGMVSYKICSESDKDILQLAAYYIQKMKGIIAVKVLDEQGNPSNESESIISSVNIEAQTLRQKYLSQLVATI